MRDVKGEKGRPEPARPETGVDAAMATKDIGATSLPMRLLTAGSRFPAPDVISTPLFP